MKKLENRRILGGKKNEYRTHLGPALLDTQRVVGNSVDARFRCFPEIPT